MSPEHIKKTSIKLGYLSFQIFPFWWKSRNLTYKSLSFKRIINNHVLTHSNPRLSHIDVLSCDFCVLSRRTESTLLWTTFNKRSVMFKFKSCAVHLTPQAVEGSSSDRSFDPRPLLSECRSVLGIDTHPEIAPLNVAISL